LKEPKINGGGVLLLMIQARDDDNAASDGLASTDVSGAMQMAVLG